MPHVETEDCIRRKYMDCATVCPVDCFLRGQNMLVIHRDERIDCGGLRAQVSGRRDHSRQ